MSCMQHLVHFYEWEQERIYTAGSNSIDFHCESQIVTFTWGSVLPQ